MAPDDKKSAASSAKLPPEAAAAPAERGPVQVLRPAPATKPVQNLKDLVPRAQQAAPPEKPEKEDGSALLDFLEQRERGPGTPQSGPPHKMPPPLPGASAPGASEPAKPSSGAEENATALQRRTARRRPAGPVRSKIAANDDAPSIGGLIFALNQKPSIEPFKYAAIASAVWALIGLVFAWAIMRAELAEGAPLLDILAKPTTFLTAAAIVLPIATMWFLALLAWRSEELRLRSSTMTEVAIRLAEPDRMAEQSVASLGQAVRRQVAFMNDAISRALGRAGELEALVHNEVSALERSYEENEQKIRGLIHELSGERHALLSTSERVTETLKSLGTDIPQLIDKLSNQQIKLANIIKGAGDNLTALESAVGQSTQRLESTLGARTDQLQLLLESYTEGLATALGARTEHLQEAIASYVSTLDTSLSQRTENLQAVFAEYARALDTSLASRAQALDIQLVERTKALDAAFGQRLKAFDESIMRSTLAIDSAVGDRARALTTALDNHAKTFSETIARQAVDLDEQLMHGITAVRRTSENITRQSLKAIEGLASQSEMLRNVSENLLAQINSVTTRFENQGQAILRAANSLENASYKIDTTLQGRHSELSLTLDRLSGKADEFGRFVEGYSSSIEGSLTEAEARARAVAEQLQIGAETAKRTALADLERFKMEADAEGGRAIEDLRRRFASISNAVTEQLSSLTTSIDQTSDEVRQRAARAMADIAAEQARIREEMERLPTAARQSAEVVRRALQDQLRALETSRAYQQRDISLPLPPPPSLTDTYSYEARTADKAVQRALSSLSPSVAAELTKRQRAARGEAPAALPRPGAPSGVTEARGDTWTLGDLLARASREDEAHHHAAATSPPALPFQHNIEVIARALDPATTSALWARIMAGQRGIMARSIYTPEGRAAFDELSLRYRSDPDLQRTVDRYLSDFERIRREAEHNDPTGRLAHNHLVSDMGRVYLFLAHVSGRIT
jgi:uncharacterized phage infection (PIP) family protein YhgE